MTAIASLGITYKKPWNLVARLAYIILCIGFISLIALSAYFSYWRDKCGIDLCTEQNIVNQKNNQRISQ